MKNKHFKSVLSIALALLMVFSACPLVSFVGVVFASDSRTGSPVASGNNWKLYEDGELCLTGNTGSYDADMQTPWQAYADDITVITITDSVTRIGARTFKGLKPAVIGIPASVTTVDADAFTDSQIREIWFEGSKEQWNQAFNATVLGLTAHFEHRHAGEVFKHAVPATCTKEGYEGDKYCSVCGAFYAKGKATEKVEHMWSTAYAYIDGREPTCSKDGFQALFCVNCGTFNYDTMMPVRATGKHNWVVLPDDRFDNCDANIGKQIVMHCTDCKAVSTDEQFKELTYKYKESEESEKIIDSHETDLNKLTEAQRALVVNAEKVQYNQWLKDLSTVKENNGFAKHHYHYETTDPTCTVDGKVVVTCDWCKDYFDTYPIAAKGHSDVASGESIQYAVPATCTENGERGTRCTICGTILSSEVIPNNHTEGYYSGTWETIEKPNCVRDGVQYLRCNYCGEWILNANNDYVSKKLAKTPDVHTASRWFTTLEPTCTEKGEQIKICTVPGCPYYSDTDLGKAVCKISDRKALEVLIAVTKDVNKEHYQYDSGTFTEDEKVFDVTNEINMAILAAFQKGDASNLDKELTRIFATAVDHHGFERIDKDGNSAFVYDKDSYNVNSEGINLNTCVNEQEGDTRYVFSQIVAEAVKILIERDSVINTVDDVVTALEQAWTDLGTAEIKAVIDANRELVAKVTDKSLQKKEIPANGHDYVRCAYIAVNDEFVPVCEKRPGEGKWYRIAFYDEAGNPVASDEYIGDKAVTEVNCVEGGGNKISQCRVCLELAEPVFVKQGDHVFETKPVPATCTEKGYDLTYCVNCDYSSKLTTTSPLKHNYVETTIKDSTCSKNGIKVKICSNCNDVDKKTYQTLDLLPHTDSPVYEKATCTQSGRQGKICSVCGRFEGEILQELGHNYKEEVVPPTCTEVGYTVATCTVCGDTKAPEKFVAVAGHQYGGKAINIAATCENGSYTYEQCSICGFKKIYNQRDNALGHQMTTVPARAATCTVAGNTEKIYCTRPGCTYVEKESQVIPAKGHKPVDVEYLAPTCTTDGHEAFVFCSVCGEELEKMVVIPALGHDWKEHAEAAPTCYKDGSTKDGHTAYVQCDRCHEYQTAPVSIPSHGHDYNKAVVVKEATPFKAGTKEETCKHCGYVHSFEYKLTFFQSIGWIFKQIFIVPLVSIGKLFIEE